jgi:hypothetical protein
LPLTLRFINLKTVKLKVKYASLQHNDRGLLIRHPSRETIPYLEFPWQIELLRVDFARCVTLYKDFWIRLFPKEDLFSCLFARLLAPRLSENHRLLHLIVRLCEELNKKVGRTLPTCLHQRDKPRSPFKDHQVGPHQSLPKTVVPEETWRPLSLSATCCRE